MKHNARFLLFAIAISFCQAQNFAIHKYGIAEGLSGAVGYDIFQDSTGFICHSTDNRMVKDGGFSKDLGFHRIEPRVKSINGKMSHESYPFGGSYSINVPIERNHVTN